MNAERPYTLKEIASLLSGEEGRFKLFHAKLFSVVIPDASVARSVLAEPWLTAASVPNRHPVLVMLGDFSSVIKHASKTVPTISDGVLRVNVHLSDAQLPAGEYLCVISPAEQDGAGTHYQKAFDAINYVRNLLALPFGALIQYTSVGNFDFDLDGQLHQPTDIFKFPMFSDLAIFRNTEILKEITGRLALQQSAFRRRLQRACDFVSFAIDQQNPIFRFSAYWIALEVLVGKAGAIRAKLSKAYGSPERFVDKELYFDEISRMRHDLVHFGQMRDFRPLHERLLQTYFWDIVRHEIRLPCARLSEDLVRSPLAEAERAHDLGVARRRLLALLRNRYGLEESA